MHSRVPAALPHALKLPLLTLQDAAAELAKYELLLLLDARPPVANFGYEGGQSRLVTLPVRGPVAPCWWEAQGVGSVAAAITSYQ